MGLQSDKKNKSEFPKDMKERDYFFLKRERIPNTNVKGSDSGRLLISFGPDALQIIFLSS